jgi:Fic family protein
MRKSDATREAASGQPAITFEELPWRSAADEGQSRHAALRARGPYEAAIPPFIAKLPLPRLDDETAAAAEDAVTAPRRFDGEVGAVAAPFSVILLRSESAASSEIEQLTATAKNIALAELGRGGGTNSPAIVGKVRAMETAIDMANELDALSITAIQAEILRDDRSELTGGWRKQQVWIGGGYSSSPHTASLLPPRHERVAALMGDLVFFARRTDLPVFAQIAIAHAQFETVHPFPDGNGRNGRVLIQAVLHRLGVT